MYIQAGSSDQDAKIKDFFEHIRIEGDIQYHVLRPAGFFAHAAQNFKEQESIILKDNEANIHGCLSLNIREADINGWQRVAWATDLRLSSDRKAVLYWFDNFLEEIKKIRKEKNLDHIFSFINKTNLIAFNTFIRPRSLRNNHPRFHLLTNFYRINVHSKIPFISKPLSSLRIRSLDDNNIEALSRYLQRKAKLNIMSYRYSVELLQERLANWQNFNKENFLIAYDAKGNIVGCVAPWNAKQTQRYQIEKYSDFYENMRQLSRITASAGITKNLPIPGMASDFYFLTHLRADNSYIFHRLLHECLEFCNDYQHLVYSSFEGDRIFKPPKDIVYTRSKFGLYLVLGPGEDLPFTHLSTETIPDFEIAFL